MAVVDVHAHFYPSSYLELVRSLVTRDDDVAEIARFALSHPIDDPIFSDLSMRVPSLETAGLASQILSFSSPNIWTEDRGLRCALVEAFNDGCHDATGAFGGQF